MQPFPVPRYDTKRDKFIDFEELKHMMEKLGAPQTHLALKEMIREVDEDKDNKISFREVGMLLRWPQHPHDPHHSLVHRLVTLHFLEAETKVGFFNATHV